MRKFKKLLAIFFAVAMAVTFMPSVPGGNVKAAEVDDEEYEEEEEQAIEVTTEELVDGQPLQGDRAYFGQTITLKVNAKSATNKPLTYTWYDMDGNGELPEEKGDTYTFVPNYRSDDHQYQCIVSDGSTDKEPVRANFDVFVDYFKMSGYQLKVGDKSVDKEFPNSYYYSVSPTLGTKIEMNVGTAQRFDGKPDEYKYIWTESRNYGDEEPLNIGNVPNYSFTLNKGGTTTINCYVEDVNDEEMYEQFMYNFDVKTLTDEFATSITVKDYNGNVIKTYDNDDEDTYIEDPVAADDIVEYKVSDKTNPGAELTYSWRGYDDNTDEEVYFPETGSILTFTSGNYSGIYCTITDPFGDTEEKWFKSVSRVAGVSVASVAISKSAMNLVPNQTEKLSVIISPADATNRNVSWTSSNPSVASVDQNGNVKALKAGKTTITVTTKDGNKSASCEVTVNEPAPQPATDPAPVGTSVTVGGSVYKVTAPGSVTYVKNTKKKAKKVTVKDTVNVNGKVLPVTGIANNAFKNNKKLTTVVIGKNVTTIGKNIFKGDKSLKKVIVKTVKLNSKSMKNLAKSVKFRGAKVTVKVPKAKKKVFKKIFKKSAKKAKVK